MNIRLAEGVHLVEVFGAKRLNAGQVRQTKIAEESVDRRLSASLGIQSDRGDDEDGIQIIIPAFYSDDFHTILLDVVADHAGPVAQVTAKFKDLVFLKNGAARASLSVDQGTVAPVRIEAAELKN